MWNWFKFRGLVAAAFLAAALPLLFAAGSAAGRSGPSSAAGSLPVAGDRYEKCVRCWGTGQEKCAHCSGGRVYVGNGVYKPCGYCSGRGNVRCPSCGGSGVVRK